MNLLSNYKNFDISKREKIHYQKKTFFYVFDFCIYIAKKYKNINYIDYFEKKQQSIVNDRFSKLRIKQYKNFVDNNILWIK